MYSLGILCSILIGQLIHNAVALNTSYRCDSPIYCEGPLLKTVQLAHLFDDSKTFVDMPTKVPESQVLAAFDAAGGVNASADAIKKFVEDHFYEAGYELKILNTTTIPELAWIDKVEDPDYRGWLSHLNQAWKGLTFEFDLSKLCDGCVSSTLPVKNKFVVPGGRFREFYYW